MGIGSTITFTPSDYQVTQDIHYSSLAGHICITVVPLSVNPLF